MRFKTQVTVLDSGTVLTKDDSQIVAKLKKILISEGLNFYENVKITSIKQIKTEIHIEYQTATGTPKTLKASHIIVATGRKPNIYNLNLAAAKIKFTPQGIKVNKHLQTSNPKVYAIGDCIGNYQFTHVAGYHAGLAIRNTIFGLKTKIKTKAIPWVTYTDPELAHVGFTELQLKEAQIPYKALQMNFDENDRAQAERRIDGTIKVLVSAKGYVLGATILGVHAGELIYPWVIAIENKLKLTAITSSIAPYPTLSDITKRTAGSFYTKKIFSQSMKTMVRFIMRWFR